MSGRTELPKDAPFLMIAHMLTQIVAQDQPQPLWLRVVLVVALTVLAPAAWGLVTEEIIHRVRSRRASAPGREGEPK